MSTELSDSRTKWGIVFSASGVFGGLLAFISFCTLHLDIEAAIWGLFTSIHASLALMLHRQNQKETLHANFSKQSLQYIGYFGIVGFVFGLALAMFYLFIEMYYHFDNMNIQLNMRLVWSLMMANWAFCLYGTTRKYIRDYTDNQLITENTEKRNPLCTFFLNADRFV